MFKKITALSLVVLISATTLTACSKDEKKDDSSFIAPVVDSITVDNQEIKVDKVLTFGDVDIPLDAYRYFYLNNVAQLTATDADYFTNNADAEEELKETTLEQVKSLYWPQVLANKIGVTLTPEVLSEIETTIASTADAQNSSAENGWQNTLNSSYLNEALYKEFMKIDGLTTVTFDKYYGENGTDILSDDEIKEIVNKDYVRAVHTLISFDHFQDDEDYADKTAAEQKTAAKELAEEILKKALDDTQTVFAASKEYSDDPGMTDKNGYYFTKGQMVEEFEKATYELKDNEIYPELVETSYGYHIIQRLPLEEEYIKDNLKELKSTHYQILFNDFYKDIMENSAVVFSDVYDQINTTTLK